MPNAPQIWSNYDPLPNPFNAGETDVCKVAGINTSFAGQTIKLRAWIAIACDADATTLSLFIRRDNDDATLVGQVPAFPIAGGQTSVCDLECSDNPGDVAGVGYRFTVILGDATGVSAIQGVAFTARVD